jgi:Papain family cysteine protease
MFAALSFPLLHEGRLARLATFIATLTIVVLGLSAVANAAAPPAGTDGRIPTVPSSTLPAGQAHRHPYGALLEQKHMHVLLPSRRLTATLPSSVNLSAWAVPVGNQGPVGSCATWAIVYALVGWYQNHGGLQSHLLNPMSVYSQVHVNNSTDPKTGYGGGSYPDVVLADLTNRPLNGAIAGADTMAHYSHNAWDWQDTPNASERSNALNHEITGFNSVLPNTPITGAQRQAYIQAALANGTPVAIGFRIRGTSFQTRSPSDYVYSDTTGADQGGHEVLALGYSSTGLWIQNSYGTGWGNGGYGYLSWAVVQQDVNSAYVISGLAAGADPAQVDVTQHFAQQQVSNGVVPVTFNWSTDPAAVGYNVWLKTDNGAWVATNTALQAGTQSTLQLSTGHSYQVLVSATDKLCDTQFGCAYDTTGYLYSATLTPGILDDAEFASIVGTPWTRYPLAGTNGGTYIAAQQAGAARTFTFTGTDAGLVAPTFSTAGSATISCDGLAPYTWNFNSATTVAGNLGPWCHWLQAGPHSMRVVVAGTSNTPWVGIDAFTYLA